MRTTRPISAARAMYRDRGPTSINLKSIAVSIFFISNKKRYIDIYNFFTSFGKSKTMSQPTLVVYRGFPERGAYVWSPFVTKLEARLRFARVSYQIETGSTQKAPRGKIPYISVSHADAAVEPVVLADSQLISDTLTDEGVLPKLNEALSPAEKALDAGVKALVEDKLCFYNVYTYPFWKTYFAWLMKFLDTRTLEWQLLHHARQDPCGHSIPPPRRCRNPGMAQNQRQSVRPGHRPLLARGDPRLQDQDLASHWRLAGRHKAQSRGQLFWQGVLDFWWEWAYRGWYGGVCFYYWWFGLWSVSFLPLQRVLMVLLMNIVPPSLENWFALFRAWLSMRGEFTMNISPTMLVRRGSNFKCRFRYSTCNECVLMYIYQSANESRATE